MPGTFYAIHLSGPKTHVAGASIAGLPGVIIGHTEGVAWGLTLSMLDDQDLFILSLDDSGSRELVDGRWQPLTDRHREYRGAVAAGAGPGQDPPFGTRARGA